MNRGSGWTFKCKECGEQFTLKPTPCKAYVVKCPKCCGDDVEFVG